MSFCCSVLHCVAVCCSVLQRVVVCCSVLQCVAVAVRCFLVCRRYSARQYQFLLQCVAVCRGVLQRVAVCCSVLQCVAVCCSGSALLFSLPNLFGSKISVLFAVCCSVL